MIQFLRKFFSVESSPMISKSGRSLGWPKPHLNDPDPEAAFRKALLTVLDRLTEPSDLSLPQRRQVGNEARERQIPADDQLWC